MTETNNIIQFPEAQGPFETFPPNTELSKEELATLGLDKDSTAEDYHELMWAGARELLRAVDAHLRDVSEYFPPGPIDGVRNRLAADGKPSKELILAASIDWLINIAADLCDEDFREFWIRPERKAHNRAAQPRPRPSRAAPGHNQDGRFAGRPGHEQQT